MQPAYCSLPAERTIIGLSRVPVGVLISFRPPFHNCSALHASFDPAKASQTLENEQSHPKYKLLTLPRGIQRPHIKDIDAVHLAEDFHSLQARGLLEVGRDGAGFSTRANNVLLRPDI